MSHPRVEEVSDSDPDAVSDPDEGDIDFVDTDIIRRVSPTPRRPAATTTTTSSSNAASHILNPSQLPPLAAAANPGRRTVTDTAAFRGMQSLYPVYFDATRSRVQGRRVKSTLAVANPLARTIADACARLGFRTLLEPDKVHPRDWANPGRVKVGLKQHHQSRSAGAAAGPVLNKHYLYLLVAEHLRANPTTEKSAGLRLHMGGQVQPPSDVAYPRPAVPRGWKMGTLLPYRSAAMTGGGVSENLFQDMMRGMQGGASDPLAALMASQQQPQQLQKQQNATAAAGSAGGKAKKKKDKKGKQRT